jgi:alcohol dehydrogenase YqhD (iron-dependent ADH family)
MSLESFAFKSPVKLCFGKDAIEKLGGVIKENNVKKLLILFDEFLKNKSNGIYDRVTGVLTTNGIEWIELWGIQPNPLIDKAREGVTLSKDPSNKVDG